MGGNKTYKPIEENSLYSENENLIQKESRVKDCNVGGVKC